MWRRSAWLTILRDVLCLGLGFWGVINEELSGKADLSRMLFFGVLMVSPGLLAMVWLGRTTGEFSSAPSPPEPSPPPSSSP